jgi:hypothetical protein
MAMSEMIHGARNSKKYGTICTFCEMCTRKSVDMREDLMAARYFIARQCAPASFVVLYGATYRSCGVGMAIESTRQDALNRIGVKT